MIKLFVLQLSYLYNQVLTCHNWTSFHDGFEVSQKWDFVSGWTYFRECLHSQKMFRGSVNIFVTVLNSWKWHFMAVANNFRVSCRLSWNIFISCFRDVALPRIEFGKPDDAPFSWRWLTATKKARDGSPPRELYIFSWYLIREGYFVTGACHETISWQDS